MRYITILRINITLFFLIFTIICGAFFLGYAEQRDLYIFLVLFLFFILFSITWIISGVIAGEDYMKVVYEPSEITRGFAGILFLSSIVAYFLGWIPWTWILFAYLLNRIAYLINPIFYRE